MSDCVVIFINKNVVKLDELLLNEDWDLIEIFPRVYKIIVKNIELNWLVKVHTHNKYCKREIERLNALKKVKGVPKILAVGLHPKLNYIMLSKAPGVDLYEYTKRKGLAEDEINVIAYQLLTITDNTHRKGIIHCDIKPENIIYDEESQNITLIDFEGKYTDNYQSPEQVIGENITSKTDLWSIGITCYYLANRDVPFESKKDILHKRVKFPKKWSEDFVDFLSCLLERDYNQRYSAKEALNHEWFNR